MEWKKFIEVSCTSNMRTGEKVFRSCYTFEGLWVASFRTELKKHVVYFGLNEFSLDF